MEGLSFLRPLLLAGLAGLLIPIIVHLLGRRRVPDQPIATLRFLVRASTRAERNWRLRRLLLLLARLLLLAALVVLFAGPGCDERSASTGSGLTWVIVLDNSPSMAARVPGGTALSRARAALERIVQAGTPADRFFFATTLRTAESDVRSIGQGRDDVLALLRGADIRHGRHDVNRALERALGLLEGTPGGRVVLATDLQRSAWRKQPLANRQKVPILVIDAGRPKAENVWIDAVERRSDGLAVRLGGGDAVSGRAVSVRLRPRVGSTATAFPKGREVTFHMPELGAALPLSLTIDPGGDIDGDDRFDYLVPDEKALDVLLVNGAPHGFEIRDELLFVRRALGANAHLARRLSLRELRPTDLSREAVAASDVVVLANVGGLEPGLAAALADHVRDGAGLILTAGDAWEPFVRLGGPESAAARSLGPLFVGPVRDLVRLEEGDALKPPFARIDPASLAGPLETLRDPRSGDLSAARFHTYWLVDAPPGVRVHARLEDGTPLLLERSLGEGRLFLLASTIDRDGADLCLQPAFVPFLERLLLHAGGCLEKQVPGMAVAGFPLPHAFRRPAVISGPEGRRARVGPGHPPYTPADTGRYRVAYDNGETADFWARTVAAESDLRRLSAGEIEEIVGRDSLILNDAASAAAGAVTGRRDVSGEVSVVLLVALAAEALLSVRRRRRREPDFLRTIAARRQEADG